MKCPFCGAEAKGKYCEYCGSEIANSVPTTNINVTNNYYGEGQGTASVARCSKCGSDRIKFVREQVGSTRQGTSTRITRHTRASVSTGQKSYRTVGICQNCGHTYSATPVSSSSGNKGCIWWLFAIMFWPISLSIWFYKTEGIKLGKGIRLGIIAAFWVFILIYGALTDDSSNSETSTPKQEVEIIDSNAAKEEAEQSEEKEEETVQAIAQAYVNDENCNAFIVNYNEIAQYPYVDFSEGNIRTKSYATTANGVYTELIDVEGVLNITLNAGNTEEGVQACFEVFPDVVKVLDSALTDEVIKDKLDEWNQLEHMGDNEKLGNLTVVFYPIIELSYGNSNARIEIIAE